MVKNFLCKKTKKISGIKNKKIYKKTFKNQKKNTKIKKDIRQIIGTIFIFNYKNNEVA